VNTNQIKLKLRDNTFLVQEKKNVATRLFLEMFIQDQNHIWKIVVQENFTLLNLI